MQYLHRLHSVAACQPFIEDIEDEGELPPDMFSNKSKSEEVLWEAAKVEVLQMKQQRRNANISTSFI